MHGLAGDVVPVAAGLIIDEKEEAVVEAAGTEVVLLIIDRRSQTDSCMADESEGHHIRLAGEGALGYMVKRHLADEERPG